MTMPKLSLALVLGAVLALLGSAAAYSAPAPWYWWMSKHNGKRVCAQFMPSQGWERSAGPFDNAQCTSKRRALLNVR